MGKANLFMEWENKKRMTQPCRKPSGMRQSRSKCNIFGQARRPAPTRTCRGDSPWSPGSMKFDFDAALRKPYILDDFNAIFTAAIISYLSNNMLW